MTYSSPAGGFNFFVASSLQLLSDKVLDRRSRPDSTDDMHETDKTLLMSSWIESIVKLPSDVRLGTAFGYEVFDSCKKDLPSDTGSIVAFLSINSSRYILRGSLSVL